MAALEDGLDVKQQPLSVSDFHWKCESLDGQRRGFSTTLTRASFSFVTEQEPPTVSFRTRRLIEFLFKCVKSWRRSLYIAGFVLLHHATLTVHQQEKERRNLAVSFACHPPQKGKHPAAAAMEAVDEKRDILPRPAVARSASRRRACKVTMPFASMVALSYKAFFCFRDSILYCISEKYKTRMISFDNSAPESDDNRDVIDCYLYGIDCCIGSTQLWSHIDS